MSWVILLLALSISVMGFNPRVTCVTNSLMSNANLMKVWDMLKRDEGYSELYNNLLENLLCGSHYSGEIILNVKQLMPTVNASLGNCKNFIINGASCCPHEQFQQFATSLNEVFDKYTGKLGTAKYSNIQYAISLLNDMNSNNCSSSKFYIQGVTGFNSSNAHAGLNSLAIQSNTIMAKLHQDQRKFLNQTACLACLGRKDFTNFIYPFQDSNSKQKNLLIYERQYFNNRTNYLTSLLVSLQALHTTISNQIMAIVATITSTNSACSSLKAATTTTKLNSIRMCTDTASCKKLAVTNFGCAATPLISINIGLKAKGKQPIASQIDYPITSNPSYGYRGNLTYQPKYGINHLQPVTIYNFTTQYTGLY